MITFIRNTKTAKIIALFLVFNFLLELVNPLRLIALTSGPGQPEMEAFTPANTNDMVDLFTGDFHYSIMLMEVPGPNGSYPVNLAYKAGITMDQEASWVGLCWNINPGTITRNMRALPDDFKGDEVKKEFNTKPNVTIGLGLDGFDLEAFGIPAVSLNLSGQIYYNTYRGLGLKTGVGIGFLNNDQAGSGLSGDLNLSWDSQSGVDIGASLSFAGRNSSTDNNVFGGNNSSSIGLVHNSRQGTLNLWLNTSSRISGGKSYGKASTVPGIAMPMSAYSIKGIVKLGPSAGAFANAKIAANYMRQWTDNSVKVPAYGLFYAQDAPDNVLKDINREKEHIINKHSNNLPVPILTNDVFSIQGQGVSGSFRAYRSDIGLLSDMTITNESGDGQIGIDLGSLALANHLGFNIAVNYTNAYSGMWKDGYEDLTDHKVGFQSQPSTNTLYEPFYFKMSGENTEDKPDHYNAIQSNLPAGFKTQIESKKPVVLNRLNEIYLNNPLRKRRNKRIQMVEYKTRGEMCLSGYKPHHIAQISVVNPDGMRYVYDTAAYNIKQRDVCFATNTDLPITHKTVHFASPDASTGNRNGNDHYYSSTELPPYAHSYLLTDVRGADYVDIDGNGPSDNDFGYWVKLKYKRLYNDYKWRIPYKDANYSKGYISDGKDNKASYSYGEKEIWFLDSIYTKTHVAVFYKSARHDALEAYDEYNTTPTRREQLKLDSVKLYSRADRSVPIKIVHFAYSYELCKNVENGDGTNGKLTLKSLWFTYGKNHKGKHNKYDFEYNDVNPDYSILALDRWGCFSPTNNIAVWPYVNQKRDDRDSVNIYAGAWNLSKIYLPSGGVIQVDYESDDYAYVQNKKAMDMHKIKGLGSPGGIGLTSSGDCKVYFEMNNPMLDNPRDYISELKNNLVYFKVFEHLMNYNNPYDYVEGYAEIDTSSGKYGKEIHGADTLGYITFKPMSTGSISDIHPFQLAGWQYLKTSRPDLLYPATSTDGAFTQLANIVFNLFTEMSSFFAGYYNFCHLQSRCDQVNVDDTDCPSFIRLTTPSQIKMGGGHRVKRIELADDWQIPDGSEYSQDFIYRTYDKGKLISSGVAEYEPMIGGEEIPLRYPVRYNEENLFVNKNEELYLEEPFGESYFPSPNIGYSKVLVYTKTPDIKTSTGVQLTEYYTAKDFPIITSRTEVNKPSYEPFNINIPFIGYKSFTSHGYSQAYSVEMNDMHGKMKNQSTYMPLRDKPVEDLLLPGYSEMPVSRVDYVYKTKNPYNPAIDNELDNSVSVLHADNHYETSTVGVTYDFFADMRENSTETYSGEILPNIDQLAWLVVPMAWLMLQQSETLFRTIVTNKITYRNGILVETSKEDNGSLTAVKNLMFDAETGEPLLSISTSDYSNTRAPDIYNSPVYSYTYPAHWNYNSMGGAYKNYRAKFTLARNNDTSGTITSAGNYCCLGDVITDASGYYHWITSINNNETVGFQPALSGANQRFTNARSGFTNQQSVPSGNIVSLTNPLTRTFPLFDAMNNHEFREKEDFKRLDTLTYYDNCLGYRTICIGVYDSLATNNRHYTHIDINEISDRTCYHETSDACKNCYATSPCFTQIITSVNISDVHDLNNYTFTLIDNSYVIVKLKANGHILDRHAWWAKDAAAPCFKSCFEVLNAKAIEYCDTCWQYDYKDAGLSTSSVNNLMAFNPYKAGRKGIFRQKRENIFYINCKISNSDIASSDNTNIGIDGTYLRFSDFDRQLGNDYNIQKPWTWTTQVTRYSPYGFEVENKSALGIYSSALYGYKSSLPIAIVNNARNHEVAFESFEDYPVISGNPVYNNSNSRVKLNSGSGVITNTESHTGLYSAKDDHFTIQIPVNSITESFSLIPGKKYMLTAWAKKTTSQGSSTPFSVNNRLYSNIISVNGWYRMEYEFYAPQSSGFVINITNAGLPFFLDDIRIQPFNALMKTFVYDFKTLKPLAELDENHYATFYNYDEEATLVQVKKETVNGIMTIKTTRQNIKFR